MTATIGACSETASSALPSVSPPAPSFRPQPARFRGPAPLFVHVQIDGFFASVEQALRPRLHGKAVLIGRTAVVSASREAKLLGITTGMPIDRALGLCPNATVFAGQYDRYAEYAERIHTILETRTPTVDPDDRHGFYLNFCGSPYLEQDFAGTLRRLQLEILKRTGINVSIGAGRSRIAAAIASHLERPHGLRIIVPGTEAALLAGLPVEVLHGINDIDATNLQKRGISTVAALRRVPRASLETVYGSSLALEIWNSSRGLDTYHAPWPSASRVISREAAGGTEDLAALTEYLCARIAIVLRDSNCQPRTIALRIRYTDRFSAAQSLRLTSRSLDVHELYSSSRALLQSFFTRSVPVRSLAVSVTSTKSAARPLPQTRTFANA